MLMMVDEFCGEQRYRCARWLPLRSGTLLIPKEKYGEPQADPETG
jgi:hypothetical protein